MKAVVLAGGFGTRLRPITYSTPKPMIPLLNRPVIEYIIEYLRGHSVDEVVITTNYLREQIIGYLGYGEKYGIKLTYPKEDKPLGTAGSVRNIAEYFDDTFIVIQGDNITDMSLTNLVSAHKDSGGLATLALTEVSDPEHYGVVETRDDGRVSGFQEKPKAGEAKSNLVNTGLYVIEPEAVELIPENSKYDFSMDLFPRLVERGMLYGRNLPGFWVDVGNPAGYISAKQWMIGRIKGCIPSTVQLDGAVAAPVVFGQQVSVGRNAKIVGPAVIGDNTVIEDGCFIGPGTVIGPNVTIKNGASLHDTIVFSGTVVGSKGRLDGCWLAEGNRIGGETMVDSNSIVGAGCKLGWHVRVHENSRIWPNISVSHGSRVSGILRQFVQMEEGVDNPYWHMRSVSDDEAFYFNKSVEDRISHTGFKARSLPEFRDHLELVDLNCIKHHLRYDLNDFRDWADKIICDRKLAADYESIKRENMWWADEAIKSKILDVTEKRIGELFELVYY